MGRFPFIAVHGPVGSGQEYLGRGIDAGIVNGAAHGDADVVGYFPIDLGHQLFN